MNNEEWCKKNCPYYPDCSGGGACNYVLSLLKEQYSCENCAIAIEDRQPVVRCKDCMHRPTYPDAHGAEIDGKWCYWCELHMAWKQDDWFCADGERR